jgi:ABC-type branched-subunit amino acid transport system substrate-binding protein
MGYNPTVCDYGVMSKFSTERVGFSARFKARWDHESDTYAAYAYDGAEILLSAIRRAKVSAVYEVDGRRF